MKRSKVRFLPRAPRRKRLACASLFRAVRAGGVFCQQAKRPRPGRARLLATASGRRLTTLWFIGTGVAEIFSRKLSVTTKTLRIASDAPAHLHVILTPAYSSLGYTYAHEPADRADYKRDIRDESRECPAPRQRRGGACCA